MTARIPLAEAVDERQEKPKRDEPARRQDRHRHRTRIEVLERQIAPDRKRARAADLAHRRDEREGEREADSAPEPVRKRIKDPVLARERLGAAEDDAVDDDERDEDAERGRERRQVSLHEQIDRGHERRDDDDVARDVHRRGNHLAERRHQPVRADQDERRREPHADRVLKRCRHRQRRAQPEHQPKRRIVLENPVPECQPCFHWLVL